MWPVYALSPGQANDDLIDYKITWGQNRTHVLSEPVVRPAVYDSNYSGHHVSTPNSGTSRQGGILKGYCKQSEAHTLACGVFRENTKENHGIRFRIGDKEKEKNRHRRGQ